MPTPEPVPMTESSRAALQAELTELKQDRRPAIVRRVAETRAEGDLSENFGYHDARQELGMVDGRIATIEHMLRHALIVDASGGDDGVARIGSSVTVRDQFGEETYRLAVPLEADAAKGVISTESPLGRALSGHRAGDVVTVQAPNGAREVTVVSVS